MVDDPPRDDGPDAADVEARGDDDAANGGGTDDGGGADGGAGDGADDGAGGGAGDDADDGGAADGDATPPPRGGRPSKGPRKGFLLRLPPELMTELRGWAAGEFRSLNAHIEYLLRRAVKERRGNGDAEPGDEEP